MPSSKQAAGQRRATTALLPEKGHGTGCTGDWVGFGAGVDGSGAPKPGLSNPYRVRTYSIHEAGSKISARWDNFYVRRISVCL
jgi:hypothetical protein